MPQALNDLKYWNNSGNKQIQKKIQLLINDMQQNPFEGIGKPEALKYELAGKWSRRINAEHRIVYDVFDNSIRIFFLKGHY